MTLCQRISKRMTNKSLCLFFCVTRGYVKKEAEEKVKIEENVEEEYEINKKEKEVENTGKMEEKKKPEQ